MSFDTLGREIDLSLSSSPMLLASVTARIALPISARMITGFFRLLLIRCKVWFHKFTHISSHNLAAPDV